MSIAVGICSCRRPDLLEQRLQEVYQLSVMDPFVFVASDGRDDETQRRFAGQVPMLVSHWNGTPCNKNKLLRVLQHVDFGIMLEDDCHVVQKGWDAALWATYQHTGVGHLCFQAEPYHSGHRLEGEAFEARWGDGAARLHVSFGLRGPNGLCLTTTPAIIERVGGLWGGFGPWGFAHMDWTQRIRRAGLAPADFESLSFAEDNAYLRWVKHPPVSSKEIKAASKATNGPIYDERQRLGRLYEPLTIPADTEAVGPWPGQYKECWREDRTAAVAP